MTIYMQQVIFFSLIGGVLSLIGGILLLKNKKTADGLAKYATPFAAGVLLAAAFTNLLPEAIHDAVTSAILTTTLIGFLGFFMLERFLRFFHHHHDEEAKNKSSSSLIIIGDTLHNALDGVAIGAAFLISPSTGIVATIAVALHEIPQEIGDFGLLLRNGMAKKKIIIVNIFSALATTVTAVLTFGFGTNNSEVIPYLLAITAGFFIYIAASDIIPEIHDHVGGNHKDIRPWLLIFGALLVMIVSPIAHSYIDAGHDHDESSSTVEHIDDESHGAEDHHEDEVKHSE
jgi:zinc and cadmium transporter